MPLPNVAPGYWQRLAGTKLRAIQPSPTPPGSSGWPGILAESSAVVDTLRRRLLTWGGGHYDSSFNGIPAFSFDTLTWSFEWPGSAAADVPLDSGNWEVYLDGTPGSRHTRDGLEYIPSLDMLWSHGGSLWTLGGNSRSTWGWQGGAWRRLKSALDTQFTNVYTARDPADDTMLVIRPGTDGRLRLSRHDPATDTWTAISSPVFSTPHRRTAAYDYTRRQLILCGMNQIIRWNMDAATPWPALVRDGLGGVFGRPGWGVEYDPEIDRYVIWPQGPDVFYLDPNDWSITTHVRPSGSDVPPEPRGGGYTGPHGRFRRDPSTGVYIAVNHVDDDVFVFRPQLAVNIQLVVPASITLETV